MSHFLLFTHLISIFSGVFSFGLLIVLIKKYKINELKAYVLFLISLSAVVLFQMLNTYFIFNIDGFLTSPSLGSFLFVLFDIVGDCSIIISIPYFVHHLVDVPNKKLKQQIFTGLFIFNVIYVVVINIINHKQLLTIYTFWHILYDILLFLPIVYAVFVLPYYLRKLKEPKRTFISKAVVFMVGLIILFIPGFLTDIFWYAAKIKYGLIPIGFFFTSVFYFLWNSIFIWRAVPFITKPLSTDHKLKRFSDSHCLTEREKELVSYLMQGMSNNEIAEEMFVELSTVKRHIQNIFQKTSLSSRFSLTQKVLEP
ncbi:helix-turn-helix transcriptional regulator [bacterium]|jgi:DNA-binding CsgD family transcriptional regulator|nr:helix-turn-helix transcriptional regulator [bacterium]